MPISDSTSNTAVANHDVLSRNRLLIYGAIEILTYVLGLRGGYASAEPIRASKSAITMKYLNTYIAGWCWDSMWVDVPNEMECG